MSNVARLRQVLGDVLGLDPATISGDASAESIEAWDSVAHLAVVLALEAEFGVQFDVEEIPGLVSFAAIEERLSRMSNGA